MENPAKFLCQNKGRDANDKTMKALANDMAATPRVSAAAFYVTQGESVVGSC